MAELPSGTVTLLFTDIEGSTRLLQRLGDGYRAVIADHHRLLRVAIGSSGHVVEDRGDGLFAAFSGAVDALSAAVEAQRALAAHRWPADGVVRVRMGLHTGEPSLVGANYVGLDVHRAARLSDAGHGGQVLLSATTRDLVDGRLPTGVTLHDLGDHRLRDIARPEHIFQATIVGLPAAFPPLRTAGQAPTNLPTSRDALIGREVEVAAARELLLRDDIGLVTLTGAGGAGKTRLGLQIATTLLDRFGDGAFVVVLAPISDPALVAPTIATALGLRQAGDRPVVEVLREHLRERPLLLLLDNFEQILSASALVVDLLAACPRLKVLVTSRAALRVRGERELVVPPLALPEVGAVPPAERLERYAAVALFAERAREIRPGFAVTTENAPAVAEICRRLDGLPLAIELAAARARLFSPQAMLSRLGRSLPFLTGGPQDLPARQQTLRDTIAWSCGLLDPTEQRLFRSLGVFVNGFTLEAVEGVGPEREALDLAVSLVDKSLVRQRETVSGEPRFTLRETVREYALEQLESSGELAATRRRHRSCSRSSPSRRHPRSTEPPTALGSTVSTPTTTTSGRRSRGATPWRTRMTCCPGSPPASGGSGGSAGTGRMASIGSDGRSRSRTSPRGGSRCCWACRCWRSRAASWRRRWRSVRRSRRSDMPLATRVWCRTD
jgi:predicted ATPase/class 3 adenylate cyclase